MADEVAAILLAVDASKMLKNNKKEKEENGVGETIFGAKKHHECVSARE